MNFWRWMNNASGVAVVRHPLDVQVLSLEANKKWRKDKHKRKFSFNLPSTAQSLTTVQKYFYREIFNQLFIFTLEIF